jgi:hypothetical protein
MNESKKLLIGFVVVGILCCGVSAVTLLLFREVGNRAERMFNGEPTTVAEIRERMVDFEAPSGYETTAMSMFIYDMVILEPAGLDGSMIMLMQYNGLMSASPAQMEQQLRQSAQQQGNQAGTPMQYVETIEREIRGETVEITVNEGSGIRQWLAVFEGKKGMTLLMVQGSVEDWDEELLDDFIASIK